MIDNGYKFKKICPQCGVNPKVAKHGVCKSCNRLNCNLKHKMKWSKEKLLEKIEWHHKEIDLIKYVIKRKEIL